MCLRAFEYLPPVDVTFGDYLRALVTADRDLYREDRYGHAGRHDRGVPPARHLPGERALAGRGLAPLAGGGLPPLPDPSVIASLFAAVILGRPR